MQTGVLLFLIWLAGGNAPGLQTMLRDGDIIFQESRSAQSQAIQLATKSPYSHMGILFRQNGRWFVYEAVGPVKFTPLSDWIDRGHGHHFVVKRIRRSETLTPTVLARMKTIGAKYQDKPYDFYFGWSNDRIYCSELVWKIYKEGADIEIGHLQKLRNFDLSSAIVRQKLRERYGRHIPLDEPVISPAAMFNSARLTEVLRR
jgi:permuted papain-like amidase YaeF/Yiix C92 family enzyme